MKKLLSQIKRRKQQSEAGQGFIEYALILAFVALAVILIIQVLEPSIADVFSRLVRQAPVAPPSLVNYTPPPPTLTPTTTATVDPSLPSATPTFTPTPIPTDTATPTATPTSEASPTATPTSEPCPYGPYTVPGRVQVEDFSCDGPGVSFNEVNNDGGPGSGDYRADVGSEGPDLQNTGDAGGGFNLGWTRDGEWLRYEVEASATFSAKMIIRFATPNDGTRVQFRVTNGTFSDETPVVTLPSTGDWQNWQNYEVSPVAIYEGANTIELFFDRGRVNVNYFDVELFIPCVLPSPWQSVDVGAVGAAGSACESGGTFTVEGSGADIWNQNDEFQFVYRALNGDGVITAQVASQSNTHGSAKAGVMIRETLADNSRYSFTAVTPNDGIRSQYRKNNNARDDGGVGGAAPVWVRLVRSGNTFTSFSSTNGTNWTQIASESINMNAQVLVGLAVSSHNDGVLSTATFTNVTLTSGGVIPAINFNNYAIQSYGGDQDENPTVTIQNNGATLRIVGNGWKKIAFPYDVTDKTVLEFDYQSGAQGEIQGIGFDNDDVLSGNRIFRVYGTQFWGIPNYANYAGETPKRYVIPVGQFYTGSFAYLVFANDHDVANPNAESIFSNVRVYEAP